MEEIIFQLCLISLAEQDGNAKIAFLQCLLCLSLNTHGLGNLEVYRLLARLTDAQD